METIIIIVVIALVFGGSVKTLVDRLFSSVDKSLDVVDVYLDGVKKDQKVSSKIKIAEQEAKHRDRLENLNAKRKEKGLPPVELDEFKQQPKASK